MSAWELDIAGIAPYYVVDTAAGWVESYAPDGSSPFATVSLSISGSTFTDNATYNGGNTGYAATLTGTLSATCTIGATTPLGHWTSNHDPVGGTFSLFVVAQAASVNVTNVVNTVTGVSDGAAGGRTPVTISGSGFGAAGSTDAVTFTPVGGGTQIPATNVVVVNDSTITAVAGNATALLPAGNAPLVTDAQVTAGSSTSPVNAPADQYTFFAPKVTAVFVSGGGPDVSTGPVTGGTPITVSGVGFGNPGDTDSVNLSPVGGGSAIPATNVVVVNDNVIEAVTGSATASLRAGNAQLITDVRVTVGSLVGPINAPADHYTYGGAIVDSVQTPPGGTSGSPVGGQKLVITGRGSVTRRTSFRSSSVRRDPLRTRTPAFWARRSAAARLPPLRPTVTHGSR